MVFRCLGKFLWNRRISSSQIEAFSQRQCRCLSGDPYQFYREPSNELWGVIEQENARTIQNIDSRLKLEFESEIHQKVAELSDSPKELGPSGQYLYQTSSGSDGQLRYSRRNINDCDAVDEILTLNLSKHELKAMSLSVDESILAYIILPVAAGPAELCIKDLTTSNTTTVPFEGEELAFVECGPIQDNGSHSLFFSTLDAFHRPATVYACTISEDSAISEPIQVYHNSDQAVIVDIQRTKGCQYVAISASTKTSSETYLVSNVSQKLLLVRPRQSGVRYHLDVGVTGDVYILASAEDRQESGLDSNPTLFRTSIEKLPLRDFGCLFGGRDEQFAIVDMDIFRDAVVLFERSITDGSERVRVKGVSSNDADGVVNVPCILHPSGNMYFDAPSVGFTVESPVLEPTGYEYRFGGSNPVSLDPRGDENYNQTQVQVTSHDGVQVPLSLFCRGDVDPYQRDNPVVLIGYGSYGEQVMRGFDSTIASLVDRGVVVAYAHTRGGGELGRSWYDDGRLYNKMNAVEDYLACAQSLVDTIVEPHQLTAKAFSAGGVTVGAAINRAPKLFGCAVFVNAFLDVTISMSNKMALTEHEYDEWGDPTIDKQAAACIASYCPMKNLTPDETHPRTLVVGTLDDPNVPYWHALAYHAKLMNDAPRHLMYMVPHGGHHMHGYSLEVAALTNSFILQQARTPR